MSKRTLAILLIVVGLAAVIGLLIWTFYPVYQQYQQQQAAQQPPALPAQNTAPQFQATSTNTVPKPNTPAATNSTGAQQTEAAAEQQLKQQALDLAGRFGSYSNVDQFEALRLAKIDATTAVQKYLDDLRTSLSKAHPQQDGSWSQATRGLSARIDSGLPITSAQKATVIVQAQVTTQDITNPQPKSSFQQITLELSLVGGNWIVSHIEQKPLEQ